MFTDLRNRLSGIPTPLAGLSLGIASLGFGLEKALPLHSFGQSTGAVLALLLLLSIAAKFLLNPSILHQELKHPVLGSILPTFAMGLMLVSHTLGKWHSQAGIALWVGAIALHLTFMAIFVVHRLRAWHMHQMVPSWFVPFVGVILAAVTVPGPEFHQPAYALLVFGMLSYAVLLPVMLYRLTFGQEVADAAKPTIAIMAAPASLSLAGYLTLESEPSLLLCSVLLGIALLMTAMVYLSFFKLLRLPFSPAFAAYTFPMAVGATALYKVAERLSQYSFAQEYARQLEILAVVEVVVASLIVAYVCLRYIIFFARKNIELCPLDIPAAQPVRAGK